MARLCRWFGVPRAIVYYRGTPAGRQGRAIDAVLVETVRNDHRGQMPIEVSTRMSEFTIDVRARYSAPFVIARQRNK